MKVNFINVNNGFHLFYFNYILYKIYEFIHDQFNYRLTIEPKAASNAGTREVVQLHQFGQFVRLLNM